MSSFIFDKSGCKGLATGGAGEKIDPHNQQRGIDFRGILEASNRPFREASTYTRMRYHRQRPPPRKHRPNIFRSRCNIRFYKKIKPTYMTNGMKLDIYFFNLIAPMINHTRAEFFWFFFSKKRTAGYDPLAKVRDQAEASKSDIQWILQQLGQG